MVPGSEPSSQLVSNEDIAFAENRIRLLSGRYPWLSVKCWILNNRCVAVSHLVGNQEMYQNIPVRGTSSSGNFQRLFMAEIAYKCIRLGDDRFPAPQTSEVDPLRSLRKEFGLGPFP